MIILVLSCDKNEDIFEPFYKCMEKYWVNHPKIIYATETIRNPYYETICINEPLEKWTKRIRQTLDKINEDKILLMIDDCFIRNYVDTERVKYAESILKGNIALINFEKSFDSNDIDTIFNGFKKRNHPSEYELSLLCGMWQKSALKQILKEDSDPWQVEYKQNTCNYTYLINSGDYIIDFGYYYMQPANLLKGKWCKEIIPFFEKEGIVIDYEKRGFYN